MAKNEFLPFGIADGASVLTNEEYGKLAARTNGFSSGVAKSQELNKVWRQASVIASVVAQFIAETNNQDVLDDGNTAALRAGLLNALRATVGSNIPVASQTTAGIAKLSNATNSEAENVAATPKAVKQAADMANQARTEAGNANATANTANQNAANANNNANSRLEKNQNGADIPNKPEFVKNIGALPTTGGVLTGKLFVSGVSGVSADIEAKGWVGATKLYDRFDHGGWSRAYSEAFPPSAAVVGAYSIKEADDRYALKKSHETFSCGGVDVEATHDWAGLKLKNANGYYVQFSATPHENPAMLTVYYRDGANKTQYYASLRKKSGEIALLSDVADNASIGINQSWRDVRSQRTGGRQYTNTAGRPIAVFVKTKKREKYNVALGIGASVNGVEVAYNWSGHDGPLSILSVFFIVPVGANYEVDAHLASEGNFIESWSELR
ncbi:phage tail protein [Xenorhabdus bovienii]|uniref:phage tail protein n=1 Tax=Xenorhabdus bovienii TaxID=40576 RepID=UPI0023B2F6D5|nr:phage tail protein [Xenorhabdus bovienii]MDE9464424.1 phage tail protein [Xenorhabdus bovienii]